MPDITVQRHGQRWAVVESGAQTPTEEHETREAAELSARSLAAGGEVHVRDDDPSALHEDAETTRESGSPKTSMPAESFPRSFQSGM